MGSIANVYADAVKKHFKVLYGNWEPGAPIELGDYGVMEGNIFIPMGKLKKDFPEFEGDFLQFTPDQTKDNKEFKSEVGVEVSLLPKGSLSVQGVELAKATLDIKFSSKNMVYFNAAGCTTTRITNKAKLGEVLKQLLSAGRWKKEYCVVTDLVQTERAIIAISNSGNAGISIEADSPLIEKINLADASIKMSLKTEKDIGYKVPADEGLMLLIGICKIKNPFLWWGGNLVPLAEIKGPDVLYRIENAPEIVTESSVDELIFGQMGMV
ncbi:MAG: hypothetical protein M1292_09580 [Bacteroidetes bacterium]|nr:hypothetical protein [Bacteroidota bacterium]